MNKVVALFGGSFDPPHIGHIAIIKKLCELEFIDEIVVMPTFLNPFKSCSFAPPALRVKWLKKIFKGFKKVVVDDFEATKSAPTPTIESILYLLQRYKKVFVVIGADNLASLHNWHRYDELKNLVSFIVASRDCVEIKDDFFKLDVDVNISSSSLRDQMKKEFLPAICADEIINFYKDKSCKID